MRSVAFRSLLLLALLSTPLTAQWKQTNGPEAGVAYCFSQVGGSLFLGTAGSIYESTDSGGSWQDRSIGIDPIDGISAIRSAEGILYAASSNAIYRSTDGGTLWTKAAGIGLSKNFLIDVFVASQHSLIASFNSDAFRSSDGGDHWQRIDSGLISLGLPQTGFTVGDTTYLAGKWILRSIDDGLSWQVSALPPADTSWIIQDLGAFDGVLLAYDFLNGMLRSTDGGRNWQRSTAGIQRVNYYSVGFARIGSEIFFGKWDALYGSLDQGQSWFVVPINSLLGQYGYTQIGALGSIGNNLFTSYSGATIFRSLDNGQHWSACLNGIPHSAARVLAIAGDTLLAGTNAGLFSSTDNGEHWELNTGLPRYRITSLFVRDVNWYAGFDNLLPKISLSSDRGEHWMALDTPSLARVEALYNHDNVLFAGGVSDGKKDALYSTTDDGKHWTPCGVGGAQMSVHKIVEAGPNLLAASTLRPYFSSNKGVDWWKSNNGFTGPSAIDVTAMDVAGSVVFAACGTQTSTLGTYVSSDDGSTWSHVDTLFPSRGHVTSYAPSDENMFAAVDSLGVFLSTDHGAHWKNVGEGLRDLNVQSLVVYKNALFAATATSGVWRRPLAEMIGNASVHSDVHSATSVQLYPNPASEMLTITGADDVTIVDQLGRDLMHANSAETQILCNVSALSVGLYWCKSGRMVIPFIKR